MAQTIEARTAQLEDDLTNLEDLRTQLTRRVALLVMVASGFAMWLTLPMEPFPWPGFTLLFVLLVLGVGVYRLVRFHPRAARHLLIGGLTLGLLLSMWLFGYPLLPFLALLLTFAGAMVGRGSEFAVAVVVGGVAAYLTQIGARAYPLTELIAALILGVALSWLVVHTLYTALQWAWNMQQRADHLLEVARNRQLELSRALRSLEIANDIHRRMEQELIVARRQAEEARRMKEQFAANISHELRTPLNLILGFSEIMHLSPEVYGNLQWPNTLRRDVHQIYRSSRHLLEMIDDILDLSRFEMVGFTLNREPTPLEPLLQNAAEIAQDLFRNRPVALEVIIEPDLPTVEIDRTRIRQVLLNLLNNAQRFTEEGKVRLEARQRDGDVLISVSDTGPGMAPDKLHHIFDEFYQIDHSHHRSHGGAGLGLAIGKRFVQAHDGRIWVESQEGVGSTFYFTLPIPDCYIPISHLHTERPLQLPSGSGRPRILVFDPDPAVAVLARRHLQEYEVIHLPQVDRLPDAVALHQPRAVIYNQAPGSPCLDDGALPAPVPLIRCSLPSRAWLTEDLALLDCLTKPVTAAQLVQAIGVPAPGQEILIIDDDRGFCQFVERVLAAAHTEFNIRRAYDGAEGVAAMRAQRPDLVLLDVMMQDMDGFEVLQYMRNEPTLVDVPVVLLTARSLAEEVLEQRGSEITIHRARRLQPAEVLRCLRAVIGVLEPRYEGRLAQF